MTLVKESLHQPSIYFGCTKSTWQHFLCFCERFPNRKNVFRIILTEYERTVNMDIFLHIYFNNSFYFAIIYQFNL